MSKIKLSIGVILGLLILTTRPKFSKRILALWSMGGPKDKVKKFSYKCLLTLTEFIYYRSNTSTEIREGLKSLCMGSISGYKWSEHYALSNSYQTPIFVSILKTLDTSNIYKVHQVGCSSGREVSYFARRYPNIRFLGSDRYLEVIEGCRERWKDLPNIRFEVLDLVYDKVESELVFSSGSLQYIDQESLEFFFETLECTKILLEEPLDVKFSIEDSLKSEPRGNLSWSHPYIKTLRKMGYKYINYDTTFREEHPWAKTVTISAVR